MATIFYSMAGEGRGHAARVRGIVELLRRDHRLTLFASGDAYRFLGDIYAGSHGVSVRRIHGLNFRYRRQRVDYFKTVLWELPRYLRHLRSETAAMEGAIRRESPDLAVTDFEPLLPRAAKRCGVPFLSVDHQHFLVDSELSSLPWPLRWRAGLIGLGVRCFYWGQRQTVVSSFFSPPLRRNRRNVIQAGVVLRPEILAAAPQIGDHVVVYLRRFLQDNVLQSLQECGRDVRVYGVGTAPSRGKVHFREISEKGFLRDLATCDALVTNGGNQVIGEAHFLGKPVLSLPEPGNFEQQINAHFLRQSGGGDAVSCEEMTPARLREFLRRIPEWRRRIHCSSVNGNEPIVRAILAQLPGGASAEMSPAAVRAA